MKKSLVALAVAGAFAAPLTAQADVAISGNVNLKLNLSSQDGDTKKNANVSAGDVRVNFAAQQDVGFGEVFGNIRLDADGLSGTAPKTDSVYAGIRGDFGTVTIGDHSVHGNYAGYNWFDTMIGYSDAALVYEAPEFVPGLSIGLQLVGTTYAEKTAVVIDTVAAGRIQRELKHLVEEVYIDKYIEARMSLLQGGQSGFDTTELALFKNNYGAAIGFEYDIDETTNAISAKGNAILNETVGSAAANAKDQAAADANFKTRVAERLKTIKKAAVEKDSDGEKLLETYDTVFADLINDTEYQEYHTQRWAQRVTNHTKILQTYLSNLASAETALETAQTDLKTINASTTSTKTEKETAQTLVTTRQTAVNAARLTADTELLEVRKDLAEQAKFAKQLNDDPDAVAAATENGAPTKSIDYNEKTETTAFAIGYTRDLGTAGVVKLAYSQATQKVSDKDSHGKQTKESENHIGVGYSNMGFGIAYDQLTKKTKEGSVSKADTKTTEITLSYATGPVSVDLVSATQKQEKVEETKATVINIDYTLAANTSIRLRNVTSPVTDLAKNTEVKNNSTFIELRQSF